MARQTVRCPPAQPEHTGRTEWPDKLSDALQHSTVTLRQDGMAIQTVRPPPPASSTAHRLA
eukprot:1561104-Rhodomonas_salina.1